MWSKGIIITFVLFASFMIGLVTICMRQDISLESKEYYKEELAYQQRIDAIQEVQRLKQKPSIQYQESSGQLSISFATASALKGDLYLYKPDQAQHDFRQSFDKNIQLNMRPKAKGLWKVKISWMQQGHRFYYEQPVFIQ